jgi:DNA primase large subunit
MRALHARYPFLGASREAVEAAGVDLGELVATGGPAVERGVERVERALIDGAVAPGDGYRSDRAELLSYPVARVLVSLVDVPGAVEKYARAEAALAYRRFTDDFADDRELKSSDRERLSLKAFLADFGLASDVEPLGDGGFTVAVGAYLDLASDLAADDWRLPRRELSDGRVPVAREELYELLREAVRARVLGGLPLSVPEPIADALASETRRLHDALAAVERPDVTGIEPDSFPPCVRAAVERARGDGADIGPTGRFALVSFLASCGAGFEEVAALTGTDPGSADRLRATYDRVASADGAGFAPPSCATMQATGDCVDRDALCAEISHPLGYYDRRLTGETPADAAGDAGGAEGD